MSKDPDGAIQCPFIRSYLYANALVDRSFVLFSNSKMFIGGLSWQTTQGELQFQKYLQTSAHLSSQCVLLSSYQNESLKNSLLNLIKGSRLIHFIHANILVFKIKYCLSVFLKAQNKYSYREKVQLVAL